MASRGSHHHHHHGAYRLLNKTAVITGGGSGIGLATAKRFVAEGAYVFIVDVSRKELEQAAAEIGRNVTAVKADVTKLEDLDRLYAIVREQRGSIDVLFNNAGAIEQKTLEEITPEHYDRTFDVNVRGLIFTVQKALPLLRDGGSVILTSSVAGVLGLQAHDTYSAAKAAVRSLARTWTTELKGRSIRVNAVSPGAIDTPIIENQVSTQEEADELRAKFAAATPLGRVGRPEELAAAVLFLASDDSSYVAGIELFVDGGLTQV
uniref:Alclohol dehydrogenase/short-chain dehydrogenase n=1 Tax=Ralstonia sp. DSMZ 6428 TaxID=517192 RepID=UPI000342279E|nr:Chain A, Alclohol dehydrogenase/short-chain dehydrogenase [Ralstonia sp. DSMZ 6428]4I5G_B Chain B, Alclohol dehydrogenase/short-chain dehydrogenase [Ralstonia sp. DSMZ 6428]4I5G_C Chain C, Alclohol dehydrogenase/short-chain dehydrogenase [Ralstonia sp. DSMZ 6428]4I5G_D Chain D, Alclohol dehydrogenase/short-chain dehydrogenase [Ralstonia sp. DSMZ 6428]4I5G_E Chain E, Alclohol dehydrogenase/short-chain dehydrogenase [Ralstonia sp. DSMZ 6428]4I5G_F Chain F, Alclohol dehydrogenase/short-chain d